MLQGFGPQRGSPNPSFMLAHALDNCPALLTYPLMFWNMVTFPLTAPLTFQLTFWNMVTFPRMFFLAFFQWGLGVGRPQQKHGGWVKRLEMGVGQGPNPHPTPSRAKKGGQGGLGESMLRGPQSQELPWRPAHMQSSQRALERNQIPQRLATEL